MAGYQPAELAAATFGTRPILGELSRDPYVAQNKPRSLLCLPVVHQGESKGSLYLENRLFEGAFM